MSCIGRGSNSSSSNASALRKKRRTIGGFRAHAMGESFDCHNTTADTNQSLSMVPEDQLSCLAGEGGVGSNHIVVAVRVRPLSPAEVAEGKRSCCDVLSRNTLVIRKSADPGAYLRSQKGSANEYSFDAVFAPEAGQSEVYEGTAKPHIVELFEGINVTVFAYGATGAGKTHTMMGSERVVGVCSEGGSREISGIVPQSLVQLFQLLDERVEAGSGREGETETWSVRVGYLQVYNEQIMDLLSPSSKPLKINEDPSKGVVVVAGLAEMEVASSKEVLELLRQGNANRRTEATGANQVSSRSHAVLQVVVTRTVDDSMGRKSVRESKLSLIDLAGSERASATNNRGEQLRQGANINKSLLSLANCINALAGNRRRRGGKVVANVKYRDSKLTHLLKASLEGRCRLVMIANVNPSHVFFDDSHNTLKYANRAKNIKVDPKMSELVRGSSGLMTEKETKLTKECQALKERSQLMEAQLEFLRNSRGSMMAPEPAGFADLFAPNTSSIMSAASSTPGPADRASALLQIAPAPGPAPAPRAALARATTGVGSGGSSGSGGGGMRTRKSASGVGRHRRGEGGMIMPAPVALPQGRGRRGGGGRKGLNDVEREGGERERGSVESSPEELVLSGDGVGVNIGVGVSPGSASKRKRAEEEEDAGEEGRKRLWNELAKERTRVRELEGKIRELEGSMARMGAQHDVNMELIDTFRHQKETAEEAAACERATADELLALLKEKEKIISSKEEEITQLGSKLVELSRTSMSMSMSMATATAIPADAARDDRRLNNETNNSSGSSSSNMGVISGRAAKHGGGGGSHSSSRSGMIVEGDSISSSSAFGPLGQIEESENGSGESRESMELVDIAAAGQQQQTSISNGSTPVSGKGGGGKGGRSEASPGRSVPAGLSTAVEAASAIKKNRRKSSMIPRSRKSMIPPPRSGGRSSSRRLNDLTNSSGTKLNNHLNSSSGSTPSRNRNTKKAARLGTPPTRAHGGSDDAGVIDVVFGGGEEGGRRAKASLRRVSSRTGATPQRVPVAGRTRSRLSMAPTCPLRNLR